MQLTIPDNHALRLFNTSICWIGHKYFHTKQEYHAVNKWPPFLHQGRLFWAFALQTKASTNHNSCAKQMSRGVRQTTTSTMAESRLKSQHNITTYMWLFNSLWKRSRPPVCLCWCFVQLPPGRQRASSAARSRKLSCSEVGCQNFSCRFVFLCFCCKSWRCWCK